MEQIFSPALKTQIEECMLALFWPKEDIVHFFSNCAVPKSILKKYTPDHLQNLSRKKVIKGFFSDLQNLNDGGHQYFNLILDELCKFNDFNSYWFQQGNLDSTRAKECVANLKQTKEEVIDKTKEIKKREQEKKVKLEQKVKSKEKLKSLFDDVYKKTKTPQEQGLAFEKFITVLFNYHELEAEKGFRVDGTQIDGAFKLEGHHYVLEVKWEDKPLKAEKLMTFMQKVKNNFKGRGVFISFSGFSEGALASVASSEKNIILIDGQEFMTILEGIEPLDEMLKRKVRAAQTRGEIYKKVS